MKPYERLAELVKTVLAVPEKDINMGIYWSENSCGTVGCRAGWGATSKKLQAEGYKIFHYEDTDTSLLNLHGNKVSYEDREFLDFFGLTSVESCVFFDANQKPEHWKLVSSWCDYCEEREIPIREALRLITEGPSL